MGGAARRTGLSSFEAARTSGAHLLGRRAALLLLLLLRLAVVPLQHASTPADVVQHGSIWYEQLHVSSLQGELGIKLRACQVQPGVYVS